jgi:hypothetical protein
MKFEVFTAMKIWIVVFWFVTPCSLVNGYQMFLSTLYISTRRYDPEDHNLLFTNNLNEHIQLRSNATELCSELPGLNLNHQTVCRI